MRIVLGVQRNLLSFGLDDDGSWCLATVHELETDTIAGLQLVPMHPHVLVRTTSGLHVYNIITLDPHRMALWCSHCRVGWSWCVCWWRVLPRDCHVRV
jgi:hypothetical protein